ncbi:MAG: hypothetical protein R2753_12440 [Chitinophagales bacterium]
MDIKTALLKEHTKENSLLIANYIGNDKKRFDELMQLFFHGGSRINQRAAWVVRFCWQNHPRLILPYLEEMVELLNTKTHPAVKRNIVGIFQEQDMPEHLQGKLLDYSFKLLMDRREPVAIRVFSMTIIDNLSNTYPEIKQELIAYLKDEIDFGSAGFKSRAKKIIQR